MAKAANRIQVKLKSTESTHIYYTEKNKKTTTEKINLKKYDPIVRKTVTYKESK